MTRPEASVSVESPVGRGVLFFVKSQVPFADDVRVVSKFAQIFRQEFLMKWQSSRLRTFENLDYSRSRNVVLEIPYMPLFDKLNLIKSILPIILMKDFNLKTLI